MKQLRISWRMVGGALAAGATIILLSQCLLIPEKGYLGEPSGNSRPSVRITGGVLIDTIHPDSAADARARVHFYWYGADNDGLIRWFEWAIDDTISANAWHQTNAFDEIISFTAPEKVSGADHAGWHTFFIRSVDDDYARSKPDRRFFNAHTIAPDAEITKPANHADYSTNKWARTLKITWRGEDTDGSRADGLPAAFEYKWVQYDVVIHPDNLQEIRDHLEFLPNEFLRDSLKANEFPSEAYYQAALRSWVRVPGTQNEVWLENMAAQRKYAFVVRAIDEAGAVEPDLNWDNWTIFEAQDKNILVYVSEQAFGLHLFSSAAYQTWDVAVAPDQRFRMEWEGDAAGAGTDPGPSNWGIDIPDPEQEIDVALDGIGGWIGWGTRKKMDRAVFFPRADEGLTHHFYIKMRDISGVEGTETRGHMAIKVARFSFHKKFLLVDDIWGNREGGGTPNNLCTWSPSDANLDQWTMDVFSSMNDYLSEGDEADNYTIYGAGDITPVFTEDENILDLLGQYESIIWSVGTPAAAEESGFRTYGISGALTRYIAAGGNLLLLCYGGPVTTYTQAFNTGLAEEPKCFTTSRVTTEGTWDRYSILYQQFHLRNCVDKPRGDMGPGPTGWTMFKKQTLMAAVAENRIYPDMELDPVLWSCPNIDGGIIQYEALWPDVLDESETPWFEKEEGMELLYRSRTYDPDSRLNDLPIAWRTTATPEDQAMGITPGRVVVFAFHPFFFEKEAVRSAMTLALQWMVTGSEF
ncbi:MAG: hypothetical protein KBD56_02785 [Candidatus Eisenbacteria bacterium]|nr:hypothetical protein [Candidatus Eisenbacteria bacterium]